MHNEGLYEVMRNAMEKWNEVMNGTDSALKDQTYYLSHETNKTYIYTQMEAPGSMTMIKIVDMKWNMTYNTQFYS